MLGYPGVRRIAAAMRKLAWAGHGAAVHVP